jgi:hypothetical protein
MRPTRPAPIDDSEPNRNLGYFENEHGIFVNDRPHSSDGKAVAERSWMGPAAHGRKWDRCRRRPLSNRAGQAGRVLEGGRACLICSARSSDGPLVRIVDRAGDDKLAVFAAQRTLQSPGPVRDLSASWWSYGGAHVTESRCHRCIERALH